ncbi:MAG TPA: RsmG family class I SAM-dependent methyltransferase [Actinomycetota bacterium]|nr:RsmG family class I SAM-dependent methyltransferase [Actinomycetota bacterium]
MKSAEHQARRLARYAALVREFAPRLDLVSPGDLEIFESRHVADSTRLGPLIATAPEGPAADVGSGSGVPGIPLAILDPQRHWTLIEPRARRAGFLEEAIRRLELPNCSVFVGTAAQAAEGGLGGSFSVVVARALAAPPRAAEICRPLVAPEGWLLLMVGRGTTVPNAEEVLPGVLRIMS